jgi:hypothetical protein
VRAGGPPIVADRFNRDAEGVPQNEESVAACRSRPNVVLGGFFIGDYIEVFAHQGKALVHYNANYAMVPTLGEGFPVAQQDNYLSRRSL